MSRVGEKHTTNEGYEVEIIEYFNCKNCTIRFENGVIIKNRQYNGIKLGKVKNPYHKSVYDIGYLGGDYPNKISFLKWRSMLSRCYYNNYRDIYTTYEETITFQKWLNYQNFNKWFEDNWKPWMDSSWQLDKDILVKGNKVYSPETCCFVPQEINKVLTKTDSKRGEYPIGVTKKGSRYEARISKDKKYVYLGMFDTPEEAFQAYKTAKEDYIKEVADKWKEKIDQKVYQAMYNYKVEITD